jgi:hypothetical protein
MPRQLCFFLKAMLNIGVLGLTWIGLEGTPVQAQPVQQTQQTQQTQSAHTPPVLAQINPGPMGPNSSNGSAGQGPAPGFAHLLRPQLRWQSTNLAGTPSDTELLTPAGLYLQTQVQIHLPTAIESLLARGLPVQFVLEAKVFQRRWYWYEKHIATASKTMRLRYQPLTQRWRLQWLDKPGAHLGLYVDTLAEALEALGHISPWQILDTHVLNPQNSYELELHFGLDVSVWSLPFQMGTFLQQASRNLDAVERLPIPPQPGP